MNAYSGMEELCKANFHQGASSCLTLISFQAE